MLVDPKPYLLRARREGWALGGFNVFDLESARAVIDAGEALSAPLLVQTSEGAVKHAGLENLVAIVRQLGEPDEGRPSRSIWTTARARRSRAQPSTPGTPR